MKRALIILTISLLLGACREDFSFQLEEGKEELNLVSELNTDQAVEANIFKSISLVSESQDINPEDAIVLFSGTDLPSRQTAMVYYPDEDLYRIRNGFIPSPGNTYEITAHVPGSDLDTIVARTYMPMPVSLEEVSILSYEVIGEGSNVHYNMKVGIIIAEPTLKPAYFQIVPSHKVSTYRTDADGNVMVTTTNETAGLHVDRVIEGRNGVTKLTHKDGVFVDYSRIGGTQIVVDLSTITPINTESEIIEILNFQTNTMSEELYLYHFNLSKQLINSRSDFSSPVSGYSNVQNGYGVLGAYSSINTSIEL